MPLGADPGLPLAASRFAGARFLLMPSCPSDAELHGFLNESLPAERVRALASHIDGCAGCQQRLDQLTHDTQGAVARYKELSSAWLARGGLAAAAAPDASSRTLPTGEIAPQAPVPRLTGLPAVPGFEVIAEMGRGEIGIVYRARHRRLNRLVALKLILLGATADARTVLRFFAECQTLARIHHPQVVPIFEVDVFAGPGGVPIPYLASELLEGGSLSHRLRVGVLAPGDAARLVEGIARALHVAHRHGIIHRDLKPANILFEGHEVVGVRGSGHATGVAVVDPRPRQGAKLPKVADFGMATFTEPGSDATASGLPVREQPYRSPEQAAAGQAVGPAADVFALGAILCECLTGQPRPHPPEANGPRLAAGISRDLAAIVVRCLEEDPKQRYASAEALADDLRCFLEQRPTQARPAGVCGRMRLWVRRNPAAAVGLAVLAVAALLGVVWAWL